MVEHATGDRLFIALWPADATRIAVLDHTLRWRWPAGAALTLPERLHLTLRFIGQVPTSRLDELAATLGRVPFDVCDIVLDQAQIWHGGIAVIAASEAPPPVVRLHAALGERIAELALPVEDRPLRVHTTVAQKARGAQPPPDAPRIVWPAREGFALVRSLPGGGGYETVQRFG